MQPVPASDTIMRFFTALVLWQRWPLQTRRGAAAYCSGQRVISREQPRSSMTTLADAASIHCREGEGQQLTAVASDSSLMLARSASSLPSRALQILLPMRSFWAGSMPYSLGITASAKTLAVCTRTRQCNASIQCKSGVTTPEVAHAASRCASASCAQA